MLILTRKSGQVVIIDMMEDLDPKTPIGELFARGPIEIMVTDIQSTQVKLGFTADPRFLDRWFSATAPALLLPSHIHVGRMESSSCAKNAAPTPKPPLPLADYVQKLKK